MDFLSLSLFFLRNTTCCLEIMRDYVLTFGDTLFPDDIDIRIQVVGYMLLVLFTIQIIGMSAGMILLSPRVVAHANLIIVNIFLFILAIIGASTLGPRADKFNWLYVVVAVVPGPMVALHTMWGTYAVRYKSVFALKIYKWMSFVNLVALGTIAFVSFTYANMQHEHIQNIATEEEINAMVLSVYKASDKCPSYRLTCRNALAWNAYSLLVSCGMYSILNSCLLALCCFAAWMLHQEKNLLVELLEDLKSHPSHLNVKAFMLAKKLIEQPSVDQMAFADEGDVGEEKKQVDFAKARLQSMFMLL